MTINSLVIYYAGWEGAGCGTVDGRAYVSALFFKIYFKSQVFVYNCEYLLSLKPALLFGPWFKLIRVL